MKKIPWHNIINRLKGATSEAEQDSLNQWLEDKDNQALYDEITRLWKSVLEKSSSFNPDKQAAWQNIQNRIDTREAKQHRLNFKLRYWAAAASVLVMLSLSSLYVYDKIFPTQEQFIAYATYAGKSRITLPDGTTVWLNKESSLKYGNNFNEKDRCVEISGEAFFRVTKDKKKAFRVRSGEVEVTVHGTVFNVNNRNRHKAIEVSLLEGSVSLKDMENKQVYLKPGEMALYQKQTKQLKVQKADTELNGLWAHSRLHFENKRFGEVATLLSKWYDMNIDVSPELRNLGFYTLTVRDESIENILQLLQKVHKVNYTIKDSTVLIY